MDAAPAGGAVIFIRPGIYREKLVVNKAHIQLRGTGSDASKVVLTYDDSAGTAGGTTKSASVTVAGEDFYAENLTIENTFSRIRALTREGSQAVALRISGDRSVLRNVRFLGFQDTLYPTGKPSRIYFADCYIEGNVDFIFGDARAFFENCEIHALAHPVVYITAQSKLHAEEQSGYVFDHCRLTADPGAKSVYLGRPWRAYSTVVFMNTKMDLKIAPEGWHEWEHDGKPSLPTVFYAEYKSSGRGSESGAQAVVRGGSETVRADHVLRRLERGGGSLTMHLLLLLQLVQDARQVSEPVIPRSCTVLKAQVSSIEEAKPDTARIQEALDKCPKGQAVELTGKVFLAGPLQLRAGVTLLVDAGATLYGSRNPRDYDLSPGSCGIVDKRGHGCKALISGDHVAGAAVMGDGTIDGRGGAQLIGQKVSWWDLAQEAKVKNLNQSVPRLMALSHCDNFTLYQITLHNSANFHVAYSGGNGFTAWGVIIYSPKTARNTDGIDPGNAQNVTIKRCFIQHRRR